MGWNAAFTIMEATVIGSYNLGKLDKDLLSVLLEPYRGSDIDGGGMRGTLTHDGKNVEQVVIEICGGTFPAPPEIPTFENYGDATEEQVEAWDDAWGEWGDRVFEEFHRITHDEFGWR